MLSKIQRIKKFKEIFGYSFEVIREREPIKLGDIYLEKKKEWAEEGCTALYIFLDDTLLEKFELDLEDYPDMTSKELTAHYISQSQEVNVAHFLSLEKYENEIFEEPLPSSHGNINAYFEEGYEFDTKDKPDLELCSMIEDYEDVALLLVKLPTDKPYEAFSYMFMGGMNDCPNPDEQTAVCKYWYEKYKAVPAVIGYDCAEFYVENPVKDLEEVKKVAIEHAIFSIDMTEQVFDGFEGLADNICKNVQWYFWWD